MSDRIASSSQLSNIIPLSADAIRSLLGEIPFTILLILSKNEEPLFSKQIKEQLEFEIGKEFTEQNIYYHLRNLIARGYLDTIADKFIDSNDRIITLQKYKLRSNTFLIDISKQNKQKKIKQSRPSFLEYFNKNNTFDGFIVLGASDSDNIPFIGQISFLLGKHFEKIKSKNLAYFDTKIVEKNLFENNLILLGSTNILFTINFFEDNKKQTLNDLLPIKIMFTRHSGLYVNAEKRIELEPDIGVIQLIKNPWDQSKSILVICGSKSMGTEIAANAISKIPRKIDEKLQKSNYCFVKKSKHRTNNRLVDFEVFT